MKPSKLLSIFGYTVPPTLIDAAVGKILALKDFRAGEAQLIVDVLIGKLDHHHDVLKVAASKDDRIVMRLTDKILQRLRRQGAIEHKHGRWFVHHVSITHNEVPFHERVTAEPQ